MESNHQKKLLRFRKVQNGHPLCLRQYLGTFWLCLDPPWCTTFLLLDGHLCDFWKGPLNINDEYLPLSRAIILPPGASRQRLTPPHCHGQHRNHAIWTCFLKGIPHGQSRCCVCRKGHIVLRLAEVWLHSMPPLREGNTKLSRIWNGRCCFILSLAVLWFIHPFVPLFWAKVNNG